MHARAHVPGDAARLQRAEERPAGPVMVEVPADVDDRRSSPATRSITRRFAPTRSAADARDIDEAAKMLIEAKCPMIIAGQGVLYAEASDELRRARRAPRQSRS